MKASEKQDLAKKLVTRLERQFGPPPEPVERSVLDSLLYAVCLENDGYAGADRSYAALHERFHDLNEIRVSSISELVAAFGDQADAGIRAHRVRSILQHVFEEQFEFDLEAIRKKTQEQAAKKLGKIRDLSSFVRLFVQHASLGAHLLPMDDRMTHAAIWLGLADPGTSPEAASDALKSAVRKAEAPALCHCLRCLAVSPAGRDLFAPDSHPDEHDPATALPRLEELLGGRSRSRAKAAVKPKPAEKPIDKAAEKPEKKPKPAAKAAEPAKKKAAAKPTADDKKPKGRSHAAS